MSIKSRAGLNDPDTAIDLAERLSDRLTRSFTIGWDSKEYRHHYYRPADCVVVFDGRDLDRVEWLDGRALGDWVAFVEAKRGWSAKGPHARCGIAADRQRKEDVS